MSRQQTDGRLMCQICGGLIHHGQPYYWDDNPKLPMHKDMTLCQGNSNIAFALFMNRNADYINGRGEPVLLPDTPQIRTRGPVCSA